MVAVGVGVGAAVVVGVAVWAAVVVGVGVGVVVVVGVVVAVAVGVVVGVAVAVGVVVGVVVAVWVVMPSKIINSKKSLQSAIDGLSSLFERHKYLKVSVRTGRDRSLDQSAIAHAWYDQAARETGQDDSLGIKCYCKLHHGVPILRAEDEEFRFVYDSAIKGLTYEQKLIAMRFFPVTSRMTVSQTSKYLELVRDDFMSQGVKLEFPEE